MTGKEAPNKRNMQKFVRYAEGAKMYSMGLSKFQELAKDAKACYKVGQLVLVNTEILDEYLETFRIVEDCWGITAISYRAKQFIWIL